MVISKLFRTLCFITLLSKLYAEQRNHVSDFLRRHGLDREKRHADAPVFTHCPNGYTRHDNSCYVITDRKATWTDAYVFCEAFGGHLAYIESEGEQHFITIFLNTTANAGRDHTTNYYWIGGTDAVTEGEWLWVPAVKPVKYTKWNPGDPSSFVQDCIALYWNGVWDDGTCEEKHYFICEIELETEINQIVG
ncbi:perlucin-like [Ruditapes philippinarum]|uniref:perlucin-like n=1 Tax=Ruditapes philippinarum TaxID=129788 RepID=UPI00295AEADB|nr:perlucin-like [Ruditapes philippinarum]